MWEYSESGSLDYDLVYCQYVLKNSSYLTPCSLLQALMSDKKATKGTTTTEVTDGIDIHNWTVTDENGLNITYNCWDFAGQSVYYNTHQVSLSH